MQMGTQGGRAERRSTHRYELSVPIAVWSASSDYASKHIGKTCVVSTAGVYFTIDSKFDPRTAIGFVITLPAKATGGTDVFIRGVGRVLRVEENGDDFEVAAVFDRYEVSRDTNSRADSTY